MLQSDENAEDSATGRGTHKLRIRAVVSQVA